ncbi:hypothetical protein BKA70DRAFT_1446361, partial [Coprinopsis sp. MPI-PUGE-AT-0042]
MSSEVQSSPTLPESGNDVQMLSVHSTPQSDDSQNLAAMFAEFMGSSPMHLFHSHAPLELEAGAQLELCAPLAQPSATMQSTLPASRPESEARLKEMQSTIDALKRQLFELQSLVRSSQEQCAYYKERAVIFKALLSLRSDDNDDSDDEAVKSIGGDDNATSFLQPLSCLFLIALAARRSQEVTDRCYKTNGECTSFAFKKLPKAREVRNADLYDLSLASRNFCTNGPNLCRSWIPIPSVIPSPLKKGGHSVNAIFASHPFTHSCQARHQGANDFEYTESAAYMAFEVDELEVPMHRGAVAFSTSTPPIGEGAIELSPILSKVYSTRGAAARPFFQCVSKWLPFYGGRYVAIDYHTTSTTSMVFLTGVANHQEFCCHRRCHRRDTKSRQHAPQASPVDPISHIATIPIFRPTSHPLLEGPSHRLIADARASAARHKLNALGPPLPPCNRNQRRQWVRIFVDDLQMHPVLYAHWIATRPDDMLLDAADLLLRSRPGLGPPAPRSNLKKSHSQRYKIGSPFAVFKNPEQYTAFHALVFHYSVERRLPKCEYPPVGYWIAEDAATFRIDNPFFREQGLYDPRRRIGQRHDVHLLNPSILSLVIPEDISVVLHDLDSWKPFASIVRNFSNSRPMLWWMKRVVDDAVGSRRTARKEEPGQLVQVGWTTGSRNNSSFDAARNLLRPHEDTTEADKENAFATAYFWRRVQLLHPPEV